MTDRSKHAKSEPAREYRFRIRCNATGEVRERVRPEYEWERGMSADERRDGVVFQWTDGNFGCDCNRARFFAYAADEEPPELDCWPEGRYTVLDATFPDGEVIPIDVEAKA